MEPLTPRSGRIKAARKLQRRTHRYDDRQFLAEGTKALTEALALPGCVVEVYATAAAIQEYADLSADWLPVTDEAMSALSGAVSPQGVVALCRFVDRPLEVVLDNGGSQIVICADVRDPGNAGTVIRTADAVAAGGVVLAGNSVDPYNDKTVRATVGSLFHLPLAVEPDAETAVLAAQEAGYTVLAADGAGELDLFDAADQGVLTQKIAWLFGNEAWGLPAELAELADHRVAIPILGSAESLNLSTAAAVCLYATAAALR